MAREEGTPTAVLMCVINQHGFLSLQIHLSLHEVFLVRISFTTRLCICYCV